MKTQTISINEEHRPRLAKLAIELLERSRAGEITTKKGLKLKFNMSHYMLLGAGDYSNPAPKDHECGTSCCFLGFAAYAFPEEAANWDCWDDAAGYVIGRTDVLWSFLFSSGWVSNPQQAASRALTILEGKPVARDEWEDLDLDTCYFVSLTKGQLIERLSKFL